LEILEKFPPDQYWYVGIGRSPTPVLRFFEELGVSNQTTIPLSNVSTARQSLGDAFFKRLSEHLSRFLPSAYQLADRKLLVIDFQSSGITLELVAESMTHITKDGMSAIKVAVLSIYNPIYGSSTSKHIQRIPIQDGEVASKFWRSQYQEFAKYGEFDLRNPPNEIKTRLEYETLGHMLREKMNSDPKIAPLLNPRRESCVRSLVLQIISNL
jgi:hypothetical protein